ncbi:hypothetical protein IID10_07850 [candidate division KSB1 bacterium]|nr:hypothetical protein [candidate division KSB1 bacterium]
MISGQAVHPLEETLDKSLVPEQKLFAGSQCRAPAKRGKRIDSPATGRRITGT